MRHPSKPSPAAIATIASFPAVVDGGSCNAEPPRFWSTQPSGPSREPLTLILDGITAEDYLAWVRDPEPPALGHTLRSLTTRATPLGDRVEVDLIWDAHPSAPREAAIAAGFPLTPEVVELRSASRPRGRQGDGGDSRRRAGR